MNFINYSFEQLKPPTVNQSLAPHMQNYLEEKVIKDEEYDEEQE